MRFIKVISISNMGFITLYIKYIKGNTIVMWRIMTSDKGRYVIKVGDATMKKLKSSDIVIVKTI